MDSQGRDQGKFTKDEGGSDKGWTDENGSWVDEVYRGVTISIIEGEESLSFGGPF